MKTVAIMAPTFLPWAGYFNMIKNSDIFIFLDDIQYKKRSWQQRNRIIEFSKNDYQWLTVPVKSKGKYHQKFQDVEIDLENKNYNNISKIIRFNYQSSPYFKDLFIDIEGILEKKNKFLIDLNVILIKKICNFLKIEKEFVFSSSFNLNSKKSQLLFDLTKAVNGTVYLSAPGSAVFFEEHNPFLMSKIELKYHEYFCKNYNQRTTDFLSYCSIIDMIFNIGNEAENLI